MAKVRIAYITAGAAGMYCGSCLHDNTLAAALQRCGHDVALIPTYTPTRTDERDVSIGRVFYGALNVYLEQKWRLFEHTPRLVHWLLDRPALLRAVSRLAGASAVQGADLGALTLSVLEGERGRQRRELDRLVDWLEHDLRPQIVHITNTMLLGLARRMRQRLAVPIVCSVQGEDLFLREMTEPWRARVQNEIRARAADIDGFIAPNDYYAGCMAEFLHIDRARITVVPLGITLEGHAPRPRHPGARFHIGFLARQCPEKGLHHLVEAFRIACEEQPQAELQLHVAGYVGARDRGYVVQLQRDLVDAGLGDRVKWHAEVDRAGKLRFLSRLDLFVLPTVYQESKGLPALEALASGVPVLLPSHGAFPELIAATRGGVLIPPDSPEALAAAILELRDRRPRLHQLGERGRLAVHDRYSDDTMAHATERVYEGFLDTAPGGDRSGNTDVRDPHAA